MGVVLNELNDILYKKNAIVNLIATQLYSALVKATKAGNPDEWHPDSSVPKGYVGGYLKGGWTMNEESDGSFIIDNPVEYAEIRVSPLITGAKGQAIQGRKSLPAGIQPIIDKYERKLQRMLKGIK